MTQNNRVHIPGETIELDGCWLHQSKSGDKFGHKLVNYNGSKVYVHRLSAHLHWGFDLDSSMLILHRCKHPNCWNPEHLYEGTHKDNVQDSMEMGTHKGPPLKTHCNYGHPLDGVKGNGKKYCKECARNHMGYYR